MWDPFPSFVHEGYCIGCVWNIQLDQYFIWLPCNSPFYGYLHPGLADYLLTMKTYGYWLVGGFSWFLQISIPNISILVDIKGHKTTTNNTIIIPWNYTEKAAGVKQMSLYPLHPHPLLLPISDYFYEAHKFGQLTSKTIESSACNFKLIDTSSLSYFHTQ